LKEPVIALAPPELSDVLVFHGGVRVLMSTAWESYPGQVAASRILSAPESSEAEAVLRSRAVTHVVLTSWDPVLPLLVKDPGAAGKNTLYARLQRWVLPRTLRPIPYQLPAVPGFQDQKIALFKVTSPQDEALSLSRLAEYFCADEPARIRPSRGPGIIEVLSRRPQRYPRAPSCTPGPETAPASNAKSPVSPPTR